MKKRQMESAPPQYRLDLELTVTADKLRRRVVNLSPSTRQRLRMDNVAASVYAIVKNETIQYVGCTTTNFYSRFTAGLCKAAKGGYRWPTVSGSYLLLRWNVNGLQVDVEAFEAELAFLHRAILGDWPIELNQISPKRFLVQPQPSSFGKRMAFGAMAWMLSQNIIPRIPGDEDLFWSLYDKTVMVW